MGFLGISLLLLPIALPMYLIDLLTNNPTDLVTFFTNIPDFIAGFISNLF